jgi:hypothetical protein
LDKNFQVFAKHLIFTALPREGREVSEFNGLEKGLGGEHAIEVHSVSVATPKPSPIHLLPASETHICWSQVKKLQRIRSWTAEKRSLRDDLEKVLVGDLPVNVV